MIFNFTEESQFATRLYMENVLLETISETKLLGSGHKTEDAHSPQTVLL